MVQAHWRRGIAATLRHREIHSIIKIRCARRADRVAGHRIALVRMQPVASRTGVFRRIVIRCLLTLALTGNPHRGPHVLGDDARIHLLDFSAAMPGSCFAGFKSATVHSAFSNLESRFSPLPFWTNQGGILGLAK